MVTLASLFPALEPAVRDLGQSGLASLVKANFVHVQVAHLISLFLLGGCVILLNLRLVGVGLQEPASAVERHLRPLLNLSFAGALVTGALIAIANPIKLYMDAPFLMKMVALLAGVVVTYAVSAPVARAEGEVARRTMALFVLSLGMWGVAVWLFASTVGSSPGVILVIAGAALVLLVALKGRARWIYLAGLAAIVGAQQLVTHVLIVDPYDLARLDPANKAFTWAEALWILGFAAFWVLASGPPARRRASLIGYCAILIWVTVAAAGRWIAFG